MTTITLDENISFKKTHFKDARELRDFLVEKITVNGSTLAREKKILANIADAEKQGKRYTNIDIMLREI